MGQGAAGMTVQNHEPAAGRLTKRLWGQIVASCGYLRNRRCATSFCGLIYNARSRQ